MEITIVEHCKDLPDDVYDMDTVSLAEYGLRNGGMDSEYHLAIRLEELRQHAFDLAVELSARGGSIGQTTLQLIDVTETKRFKYNGS